jgi:tetratricopeptide (TPR) repeat protein
VAATQAGLLVVLDDMHWADRASVRLLTHVAEDLASSRVLLLVNYRSTEWGRGEVVADLDVLRTVTRISLRGLPIEAAHHQLVSTSGQPVDLALSARVHALTGGNPLFVSELGRLLAEDAAAGTPIGDAWPHEVPATVRALIRRRLRRLDSTTQAVLHAAAIFGREFPVAVVAAMVRAPAMTCLDELQAARAAGLVELSGAPGRQRFVHALVRDAVVADLSTSEQVRLHRAAAEAVDRDVQPAAIADHRAAAELAVPMDQRDPAEGLRAARWATRAADEAMHHFAWEEGVRLRRLALDLGGSAIDDIERCELLLGLARALAHSGEFAASLAACHQAADLARGANRSDLLAEAALVLQGVGDPVLSRSIQRLAEEALEATADGRAPTRARLLAQLTEAYLYQHDEERADASSREALAEADAAGDRDTVLIALHARRLATLSPDQLDGTLGLADRVLDLVSVSGLEEARHTFWARVWRIQVWFVRGRLDLIANELEQLALSADELREPMTTAQLLRFRAILASARGSFADALDIAERAHAAMLRTGQAVAGGQHAGFRCSVGRFVGYPRDLADALALPQDAAGPFAGMGRARSALVLAGLGRVREAAAEYRRLDPVAAWPLPSYVQLTAWALRLRAAVALAIPSDIAALVELLTPHRGLHAGGGLSYDGPVELAIATGAAALGELDTAAADLQVALNWSRAHGARPFVVEAAVELAGVLAQRAGPGDVESARTLLDEAETIATELDMTPFAARVQRLRPGLGFGRSARSRLSDRETQVAQLVARGLTNRQIPRRSCCQNAPPRTTCSTSCPSWGWPTAPRSLRGSPRARRSMLSSGLSNPPDGRCPVAPYGHGTRGDSATRT